MLCACAYSWAHNNKYLWYILKFFLLKPIIPISANVSQYQSSAIVKETGLLTNHKHGKHMYEHVIRVVFKNRQCTHIYIVLGVQTCPKFTKKVVISVMVTNVERKMTKNYERAFKNIYLGLFFMPGNHVFWICFESHFTRMISSLKYKCSPPPPRLTFSCVLRGFCHQHRCHKAKQTNYR